MLALRVRASLPTLFFAFGILLQSPHLCGRGVSLLLLTQDGARGMHFQIKPAPEMGACQQYGDIG